MQQNVLLCDGSNSPWTPENMAADLDIPYRCVIDISQYIETYTRPDVPLIDYIYASLTSRMLIDNESTCHNVAERYLNNSSTHGPIQKSLSTTTLEPHLHATMSCKGRRGSKLQSSTVTYYRVSGSNCKACCKRCEFLWDPT